jgi:hypothetical protein
MAILQPSPFCRFEFSSPEELLQAQVFSPQQLQWIQTALADAAEERLKLTLNPAEPQRFIQAEANLKGQIEAFQYLKACSEDALEQLKQAPQNRT